MMLDLDLHLDSRLPVKFLCRPGDFSSATSLCSWEIVVCILDTDVTTWEFAVCICDTAVSSWLSLCSLAPKLLPLIVASIRDTDVTNWPSTCSLRWQQPLPLFVSVRCFHSFWSQSECRHSLALWRHTRHIMASLEWQLPGRNTDAAASSSQLYDDAMENIQVKTFNEISTANVLCVSLSLMPDYVLISICLSVCLRTRLLNKFLLKNLTQKSEFKTVSGYSSARSLFFASLVASSRVCLPPMNTGWITAFESLTIYMELVTFGRLRETDTLGGLVGVDTTHIRAELLRH